MPMPNDRRRVPDYVSEMSPRTFPHTPRQEMFAFRITGGSG